MAPGEDPELSGAHRKGQVVCPMGAAAPWPKSRRGLRGRQRLRAHNTSWAEVVGSTSCGCPPPLRLESWLIQWLAPVHLGLGQSRPFLIMGRHPL